MVAKYWKFQILVAKVCQSLDMPNFGLEILDMPKFCRESLDMSLGPRSGNEKTKLWNALTFEKNRTTCYEARCRTCGTTSVPTKFTLKGIWPPKFCR